MSNLPNDVLQDFSDMVLGEEPEKKQNTIYGTIVEKNGNFYVKIDGSEELTPVNASVEIEDGDRVLLSIEGRMVTAIGNITAPASARTATNYMKLTKDGLMVGNLGQDGKPDGSYTLMKGDAFQILAEDETGNNRVLAEFTATAISFGNKASFSENGVTLSDGKGKTLATFTKDGVNFDGRASFASDGVKLYDASGNIIASFSDSGVILRDKNGKVIASFNGDTVSLGDKNSSIMLGLDDSGIPMLRITKDGITSGEDNITLMSERQATLWARKNDKTYVYAKAAIDESSGHPLYQIWGNHNEVTEWQLFMDRIGIRFVTKYNTFQFNGRDVAVIGLNAYSRDDVDRKITELRSYVNNLHGIIEGGSGGGGGDNPNQEI